MEATKQPGAPATSVFVGNLAYDLSEQDVIDFFSQVGPVKSIRIVNDRETGKSRGFGFVEFYDVATAESCVRNLNATDLNGRTLRIVFATEGNAQGMDNPRSRPGQEDRMDDRQRRQGNPHRNKIVGGDLAYHSSQGMNILLGGTQQPGAPADPLTSMLARKTRSELYEYLAQMQSLLHQNPQQARRMLADNPQLARALFHMEIILGMVSNPLGDIAPKGVSQVSAVPSRQYEDHQQYQPPSDPRLGGASSAAPPPPMDPRIQPPAPMISAVNPPLPMMPAPRPMVSAATAPAPVPAPVAPQPPAVPGMTAEQQQALLQQVMSLTPAQIDLLPPAQKAQVVALQQQLGVQGR